ncbi:hypothetical protein [Streptomyces sp. NPDC101150]|uniref:golvesin C-terminal-like domain-containing protein n=1 Tax=Streptomyces sp. NPDC101150 TaxID=3366114 RepID=UPI0037F9EF68
MITSKRPRWNSRRRRRATSLTAVTTAAALTLTLTPDASATAPAPPPGAAQGWATTPPAKTSSKPSAIPADQRSKTLGAGYKSSTDTALTTSGDATGFHLFTARESAGYHWKTAATLRETGFDADTWIGNACLTGSGKYAAVAYAPRTFTNRPELMARGAFTAVVNLVTGKVTKLPFTASLAYFSPGCGTGDQVVFTQLSYEADKQQKTRLITVDAPTGKPEKPIVRAGEVTSAIPTPNGIVAAHTNRLVRITADAEKELARTRHVPFQITADASGGVTFIDRTADTETGQKATSYAEHLNAAAVKAAKRVRPATLASGRLPDWDLTGTAAGKVFITGRATSKGTLPAIVKNPGHLDKGARLSSLGHAAVSTAWADGKTSLLTPDKADQARDARTTLRLLATGKTVTLDAAPAAKGAAAATGTAPSPALASPARAKNGKGLKASASDPSEGTDERYCAVARNDPKKQAFQPTPRQVEWAVDQAVVGELMLDRPANWKNTGMDSYSPQGLFPPVVLAGDPNGTLDNEDPDVTDRWHIPSQVMLGVTAQESNMWQATRFAVPGVTSNSLIGNYYGTQYTADGTQADPWRINFSEADCGYGITQATDGMRLAGKTKKGETALPPTTQEAVALDYTTNIAYGVQILAHKWNDTYYGGMKINGGNPQWIENWFFALWAYNSGFYNTPDTGGHQGLGWTNNPANPLWKANRVPFLENAADPSKDDYSHAAHPQDWPYEEKVLGWAARPISAMFGVNDFKPGYLAAWWSNVLQRSAVKPPTDLFCDSSNNCDPSKISDDDSNDPGQGACMLDSGDSDTNPHWLHCWWKKSASWKDCDKEAECGHQVHRFNTSYGEQADANSYPPRCASGLPAGALIVDDLPNGLTPAGSGSRGCGPVKSDGTFTLGYQPSDIIDAESGKTITTYPGKIDTHQIGAGYGNHFWFTHTRSAESYPPPGDRMKVTGTWKLGKELTAYDGQARVYAHIPDHGAQTGAAHYKITSGSGVTEKTVSQKDNQSNKWVDLGAYSFAGVTPTVSLDNFNGGDGAADIAFDAVAFVPGDYWGLPDDLAFSDPADEGGPDPEFPEDPQTISGHPFWTEGISALTSVKPGTPALKEAVKAGREAARVTAGAADTASCSLTQVSINFTRTDACIVSNFSLRQTVQGTVKQIGFNYRHEIHTDPKSKKVTQRVDISVDSAANVSSAAINFGFECKIGYCVNNAPTWTGSSTFNGAGDTHHLIGTQTTDWNGTGSNTMELSWKISASLDGQPATNSITANEQDLMIRCDDTLKNVSPGCIFPRYKPTYTFSEKKYPAAAAHIWIMQHKLPTHFGLKGQGEPLNFLSNDIMVQGSTTKTQKQANRDLVCPDGWAKKFNPTLVSASDQPNCDEFTFAASYQSGGMPKRVSKNPSPANSGDDCLSTVTMKDPDGKWRLHPAPGQHVPTWTETCARSAMSGRHNQGSMNRFGGFMSKNRLLNEDPYWLDVVKPQ